MAIINGPCASKMRGKVGEVVAAKTTGNRTALRSYQPNVKNPNTLRQRVSRSKMALASELAALLSDALKIGFAKAAAGTKMYPRNLFVKRVVPVSAGIMTVSGEAVSVDYAKLPLSEADGFGSVPVFTETTPDTGFATKFALSNPEDFPLEAGESLGIVVTGYDAEGKCAIVKTALAEDGAQFTDAEMTKIGHGVVKGFVKAIPEALNGVPTKDIPWKYPSRTSASSTMI